MQPLKRLRLALSGLAIALLAVHLIWPLIKIDAIAVSLLLIAVLPWLAPLIKSVEVPGVGKVEFQELKDQVEQVQGAAQSAILKSEFASAEPSSSPVSGALQHLSAFSPPEQLAALAQEYDDTRQQMRASDARTIAMTAILRKMVDVAATLAAYDVAAALRAEKSGLRLTAYAYLFARPDFAQLALLVDSLTTVRETPFGQYWALQALGKLLAARKNLTVDRQTIARLRQLYPTIQAGTDRQYELGRILKELDHSPAG